MALYHFSGSVVGRKSTPGASCCAGSAYRSAEKIGEHDYTKKSGVVWSDVLYCERCPEELRTRSALWSAMDDKEKRSDAQLYRSFDFAFPNEFTYQDCVDVVTDFAQREWVDRGMCADLCVHDKTYNGQRNLHGHAMLTMRDIDENGIGKKNREWNEHALMEEWRSAWSDVVNARLELLNVSERVDHRSYERQGETDLQPTKHLGKSATALERKGILTRLGEFNRRVMAQNDVVRRSVEWLMKKADRRRKDVRGQQNGRERTRERTR